MRWIFLAVFAVFAFATLPGVAADLNDDPEGFDGIRWGTSPPDLPGLELIKEEGDFKTFTKRGSATAVCEIIPDRIKYQFFKERLELVLVSYHGKETHDELVACALRRYGPIPRMKPRTVLRVDWEGPATIVSLAYDPYTHEGTLSFSSRAINVELFYRLETTPAP